MPVSKGITFHSLASAEVTRLRTGPTKDATSAIFPFFLACIHLLKSEQMRQVIQSSRQLLEDLNVINRRVRH